MSDLPRQGLFQQMHAAPHSGDFLEVLGKRAAALWGTGDYASLTEAVVGTVKQAQLSPEQVRRVVEFTNTAAYLDEFHKEGSAHKVIDFPGGPADPAAVLQDLNDGGGGSVFDPGNGDYDGPPMAPKEASAQTELALADLFSVQAAPLPYANPHGEVIELQDKFASAVENLTAQISGLEVMHADLVDRLYHQVKQAALSGVSLGDVLQAWQTEAPSAEYIKVAFARLTPRLLREGVFPHVQAMTASVDKTASACVVNTAHPLVSEFSEFCTTLAKLAESRAARQELREHLTHLQGYIKQAALAGDAYRAVTGASAGLGRFVRPAADAVLGQTAGGLVEGTIRHAPDLALLGAGSEAYTHAAHGQSLPARAIRGTARRAAREIPGTQEHLQHVYEVERGS